MGFVDPRASTVAQNKISICRALLTLGAVIIAGLMAVSSRAADFHTNATFNATFSLPGVAQNTTSIPNVPLFTLSNLWTIAPSNEPGSLITPDGANQGAIAYNAFSNQLYLVSRSSPTESNYVIYALTTITSISEAVTNISDGVTNISEAVTNVPGTVVSMLNTNGIYNGGAVGEGGIGLASIGVADDGAIYAGNMSVDACGCGPGAANPADSLFRIYRWADGNSNTAPVEIFSGDPAGQAIPLRWGDTLAVRGGGTNTQILVDTADGRYAALLTPADEFMTNFVSSFFTNKTAITALGRSLQLAGTNSFLQKGKGTALRLAKWDTAAHTFSIVTSSSHFPGTLGPVITNDIAVAAAIDFKGSATSPDGVKIYELGNFSAPTLVGQADFPTNQQSNPEFAGQVVFSGNYLWALDANDGLMALHVNGPRFLTFYTAVPGHIGNKEIIQALTSALHTNLPGAKLMVKTTGLGTDSFKSVFILRKGASDFDVSAFLPFNQPLLAIVSAESSNPAGALTNAIDYTVTHFTLSCPLVELDVQGFGTWKSSSIVNRGQTIMAAPFPNSITVSSLDGVAVVQGVPLTLHGSMAITGRKLEIVPNLPPVVTLSSPTNSQTFTASSDITLQANASDSDGSVSLVEFFQDGNKLGEATSGSSFFSFTWTNAPAGTFNLFAKATDNDGATSLSNTNTITVSP